QPWLARYTILAVPVVQQGADLHPGPHRPSPAFKRITNSAPEFSGQKRRNCVADLGQLGRGRTSKANLVGEGLKPRCLPDGDGAVLIGMDEPVSILSEMGDDRSTQVAAVESFIAVIEYVVPIPFKVFGDLRIPRVRIHHFEYPEVVGSHTSRHMVVDTGRFPGCHCPAGTPLEVGLRSFVWEPSFDPGFHPTAINRR